MKRIWLFLVILVTALVSFLASIPKKYIDSAVKARLFEGPVRRSYAAVDMNIENAEGLVYLTLTGTVLRGDLVAYDGSSGWVQADASDAATNLYAQFVALQGGVSGDVIQACRGCELYDADGPYTAGSILYTSGTAGAMTHTRPATAADVIQAVGIATSAYRARIDVKPLHEVEVFIPPSTYDTTAEAGLGVIDSPVWVGPAMDTNATTEDVYFQGRIPSNAISCELARVVWNSIGESTGTVSGAIIVCADGATNTGDTGTAFSAAAPTSLADNKICYSDITACFDADAFKSGYDFNVAMTAAGATNGNLQAIGLYMRYLCV